MEMLAKQNGTKSRKSTNKRANQSLGINGPGKDALGDWECPGYKCEKLIGQGSYGSVAQAT
jgi:hypothetical protein